ncbi:sodium/sugar symporter [Pseudomaricurvus alkylphenolicus]|uniref:sodium/sugar symporter n=1 Tax=Pseudomaricurvus alkylphenolicus TaxID=1306991 RepID=UPI00197FF1E4|nr:sodium/sugar symporter [Pseudomaricurvus alkylphenolicus]
MNKDLQLSIIDISLFLVYVAALIAIAYWVSRERDGHDKDSKDYFLAGNSLPWWAVGASLIAANISAEQIIGMSGSGYAIGLAIASYEWMAAITLIVVGKYFLPIYFKRQIYTMPQFLEERYDARVKTTLAIFWLGVYVFVNLTSVLWLGALAVNTATGIDMLYGMIFLGAFSVAYSLYGGLKAVALTDIIQVVVLILGGVILSYICLDLIGAGRGVFSGVMTLMDQAPGKFNMILERDHPHYVSLPGISVLVGGMWVMNLSYWGFNQYIIQRTLAAKSLEEGQRGITFAAYLKLLMPIIVVLPGIAAVLLAPELDRPDQAYPTMMQLMPEGVKGLVFAALVAAIVSSLGSMTNSIATIFTIDLYSSVKPGATEKHYVRVGRWVSLGALVAAMICAKPLLGNFDQAFQYIQEFTGFFTPGIVALFLLGMFWKRATANAALVAAVGSAVLSLAFKLLFPELPFIDRVGVVFIGCLILPILVVIWEQAGEHRNSVDLADIKFTTSRSYNAHCVSVSLILAAFYVTWW